jgi:hypothetical protein
VEAEKAEDTQVILRDALQWVTDKADPALLKVGDSSKIIKKLSACRIGEKGVDGKIPAGRIFFPVIGEGDDCAPSIGVEVTPKRRDFERMTVTDRRHRPMFDPRWNGLDVCLLKAPHDFGRIDPGRKIDVADR